MNFVMNESLQKFRSQFLEGTLALLWRQWSALGISGYTDPQLPRILDPEALLCATCIFGRYEPRLFDEAADWLRENGALIHLSRLKTLARMPDLECSTILAALTGPLQKKAGTQKWKALNLPSSDQENLQSFFINKNDFSAFPQVGPRDAFFASQGWFRGPLNFSHKSSAAMGNGGSNFLIRLRALFGVNARCEILAFLLDRGYSHPHEVARQTHYFVKTVQDAMVQMRLSGLVTVRSEAGKKIYGLDKSAWSPLLFPNQPSPIFLNWPVIYAQLAGLWKVLGSLQAHESNLLLVAAKLKEWARTARPLLDSAGLSGVLRSEELYPGESYLPVFMEDVIKLTVSL
jgi:hypothetical protein